MTTPKQTPDPRLRSVPAAEIRQRFVDFFAARGLSLPTGNDMSIDDATKVCDALAAVLRTYTPGRKFAVVTMPGHAILAVDLPSDPEDWAIRADGRQFVALEVAGPAMAGVGQVGAATARMLKEGREVEIWPLN